MSTPTDQFSDAVAGITTLLTAHHDEQTMLRTVIGAYGSVLAADAVGVMGSEPGGDIGVLAASDDRSRFVELLQVHVGQGPCLECINANAIVSSPDLDSDEGRWPRFVSAAVEVGYHAVHAFPLTLIDQAVGGVNLLYNDHTELSPAQLRQGQALADLAMLGLTQERDQRRIARLAEQTLTAMNDRVHVSQAVGMLSAARELAPDTAREYLAAYAIRTGTSLREVARALTDGALAPDAIQAP